MIADPNAAGKNETVPDSCRRRNHWGQTIPARLRKVIRALLRHVVPADQIVPASQGENRRPRRTGNGEMADEPAVDHELTELLLRAQGGDAQAEQHFFQAVNEELRRTADRLLQRRDRQDAQATSLVDEVFVNLFRQRVVDLKNRRYFFTVAATEMLRVLGRRSRDRRARKRDGAWQRVSLDQVLDDYIDRFESTHPYEFLDLDDALTWLREQPGGPLQYEVAIYRYLVGLTIAQTAEVLGLSSKQVTREWDLARAKLARMLGA